MGWHIKELCSNGYNKGQGSFAGWVKFQEELSWLCRQDPSAALSFRNMPSKEEKVEVLKTQTFKDKIFDFEASKEWKYKGSRPAIIDFYADWCGPCRMLAPVLERLAERYKGQVDIYKVDTEASPDLAGMFGVRSIPALLFIPVNGDPAMSAGFMPEEGFDQAIGELFSIPKAPEI